MGSTLNLSLTDDLRAFVDQNSGDGMCYATASEFVRDLRRQKKMQQDAQSVCDGILEGYQDTINRRTKLFMGDLQGLLKQAKK